MNAARGEFPCASRAMRVNLAMTDATRTDFTEGNEENEDSNPRVRHFHCGETGVVVPVVL